MKLFTLFFACSLGLAHASESYAQTAIVNVEVQNKTVGEILKEIEKQSDFDFFFDNTLIDLNRRVSVTSRNSDIFKVLEKVFKGINVKYSVLDKKIVLTTNADNVQTAQQTTFKVTGKVVDNTGEGVIGATVLEQGTTNGTVTDMDGNFELVVSNKEVTLEISYIGYSKSVVKVKVGVPVAVTLKEDTEVLDEVVVVGYGTQKKVNLTGSVSQVGEKAFEARPVQNVTQALQGMVPGVNVSVGNNGGMLNSTPSVSIRGAGTIGAGSTASPLVLIDGVEGNMNILNPQDIESISVLKDAASASVYGSRAPFGVILITTKKGKSGKTNVNYSNNFRWNSPLNQPEKMDSWRFVHFMNDARTNAGQDVLFGQEVLDNLEARRKGEVGLIVPVNKDGSFNFNNANADTDFYKLHYKDWALSQEHSISVSGGNDKLNYYVSGNFMDQEGLLRYADDSYKRYTMNSKITAKINKRINFSYNSKWFKTDYEAPSYLTGLFFHEIMRKWPNSPAIDPNGYPTANSQIIHLKDGGRHREKINQIVQQLVINITPLDGWNIHLEGNARINTNFQHTDIEALEAHDGLGEPYQIPTNNKLPAGQSRVTEIGNKTEFFTTNLYSDYSKQLGNHFFKIMLGFNAEVNNASSLSGQRDGIISNEVPTLNTATLADLATGGYTDWATAGFFGRINYNYKDRYMVELNGRYDGTSRFLRNQRWNLFPSFSVGWNVAKEKFWESLKDCVNMLKFKASWGELGNQNTSSLYPFYETMPLTIGKGQWLLDGALTNTANIPALVSTSLTWERIRSFNIGLDFGLFSNRLTGTIEYFKRKTLDMVGPAPQLPAVLGIAVPKTNNADMESVGFDFDIQWRDKIGQINYGIKFNLSDAQAKVTRYPNTTNAIGDWYAGKKSGVIWGYTTIGIAKSDQEMQDHLATLPNGGQNKLGSKWGAGDIMYADINHDGQISGGQGTLDDHGDRTIIGNSTPRFNFGLVLDASYKGFDVSAFFQGVGKRDFMAPTGEKGAMFWGAVNSLYQTVGLKEHWDYFRPEEHEMGANLDAYYPRPDLSTLKNQQAQTRYLQNAAYIRLKNIQIGYTLPRGWIQKMGLNKCRIYISGDNLWTGSKIADMYDPEALGSMDQWGAGKTYPLSKVISCGVSINM
ncbi:MULTISPECIES: TonB-dependent receptor [Phocaeicola]|nr:TonB-dependent receptor [Phocaeicola vulgatus]